MTWTTFALMVALAVLALSFAVSRWLAYATRSTRAAIAFWPMVEQSALKLMSDKYPPEVRSMAMQLGMTTGCGCYVSGFLVSHYMPWLDRLLSGKPSNNDERIIATLKRLDTRQRDQVDKMIAATLFYDSLTNPLRGSMVRRVIKYRVEQAQSVRKPQDLPMPTVEAKKSVIHTVTVKTAAKREAELCTA